MTLENMLTMTTGLESSLFFCDWPERYTTPDWIRYFFENAKVVNKPGTQWLYSNFNTYMISCAIEKRAGVNLLEYLRNRFLNHWELEIRTGLCVRKVMYMLRMVFM